MLELTPSETDDWRSAVDFQNFPGKVRHHLARLLNISKAEVEVINLLV